ncbi:hypothetical protein NEF87_001863 [Candidatus Lokiarchaeum ossiferum]|uniref:Aminoglycoside phosphotransferase domain-containing protein n=1 Tax=Candidatus Lokiarchaeum ossiferum TaxID=2951803 RepID=A0ABY6HPY5_9ARCH|nr:hypothetical protein NEF87_001863 [Candidatus Lokiarchaeum sp. B-35]
MGELKGKLGIYLSKIQNESGEFEILQLLEKTLDVSHPEQGEVPIKILGFGEISLVFEVLHGNLSNLAFKRLPIFESKDQITQHINAYNEYNRILQESLGIQVPSSDTTWVFSDEKKTKISLYCIQDKVDPSSIGSKVIHNLPETDLIQFIRIVLTQMKKVWDYNQSSPMEKLQIGLDGQISNWSVIGYDSTNPTITLETQLLYIDTSTPMYRINGEDAMEGKLFLKSAPSFLRWVLKPLLQEVLDRYYNWRDVVIDMVANFYKEQLADRIPAILTEVNHFFANDAASHNIAPLSLDEVKKYYKHDKFIWVLFQQLRKFDRFLKTKILRKRYDFYLPPKIKR